ncbi:CRISPR-associated endonuclease Cas3'' [Lactonifactor longoviformis]|uniref:CRISPR-associated endonuclease Cas3'' n=1 Tax=Lactonifactor longoviformis TaxID=341220 RepID=UPI0036F3EAA8
MQEHLINTVQLAGQLADKFCCRDWGFGCGLLHDIGKYSKEFQLRLHGGLLVDHATAGAKELYNRGYLIAAYCVVKHHSGLPDGGTLADIAGGYTLHGRIKSY